MDKKFLNERGVIAATLRNAGVYGKLSGMIRDEHFQYEPYRDVWQAIGRLVGQGSTVDILTLSSELEKVKRLESFILPGNLKLGGMAALSEIREIPTTREAAETYANNMVDTYAKKQLIDILTTSAHQCNDETTRAEDVLNYLKEAASSVVPKSIQRTTSITDISDDLCVDIEERAKAPGEVWGIPYAFPYLTLLTGGKQAGELIVLAGEPKVGKSWWVYQDALETAVTHRIPVFIWSGEMKKKQVLRRLFQLLGLDSRRSRTGFMTQDDWGILAQAKETVAGSPLYIDDQPMRLDQFYSVLSHEKDEHGIQQFVADYSLLIHAPGKDEIERTANTSREMKRLCNELDLAGILITSVNKAGMDTGSETIAKANVRGSGQQIHDADIIYILTKYHKTNGIEELSIHPSQFDRIVSLHIAAGRELDHHLPHGIINYERRDNSPEFYEMKEVQKNTNTNWIERKDM